VVCLLTFSFSSLAQSTETFDISTFQSPIGWKKQSKDGVLIFNTSNQQKNTYAMIMLYASGESSGNAKSDFESDWQQFIDGQLGVKNKPQLEPAKNVEGWESITGAAAFENEMGTSAVILNTFSGYGKTFSMAAIFNSQGFVVSRTVPGDRCGGKTLPPKAVSTPQYIVVDSKDNVFVTLKYGMLKIAPYGTIALNAVFSRERPVYYPIR
jgi:hypothetical protein